MLQPGPRALAAALLCGIAAQPVPAEEPLVADRPDFTEGIETLSPGRVQLEEGYTFTREGGVRSHALGEALIRIGSGPRSELRIGLNSYVWQREEGQRDSGFEDASIGFKLRLRDGDGGRPGVAVLGETTLPTGAAAFGSDRLEPKASLALSWDLAPRLSLGSNLGMGYPTGDDGDAYREGSGSLSLGYDASERVGAFLEVYGFVNGSGGGPNRSYVNAGATYLVDPDLRLDARAGVDMNGLSNDYFIGAGVSRRF